MSQIVIAPNALGTAQFTIAAPGTSVNQTITLPDATTTLVGTDATQTLTNKTLSNCPIQGGGITQGVAQVSTSGTNIDFTGIPSWAKRVTVMFSGVSTSGGQTPFIQLGTSAGPQTTGYESRTAFIQASSVGTVTAITSGFPFTPLATTAVRSGFVMFSNITGNTWVASGNVTVHANLVEMLSGGVALTGTLDRIRIAAGTTDTFDLGTINIMWEG